MIAVDTSVVVAAFASWHEGHRAAAVALDRRPRVPAHVLIEVFAVLTRLPPPHRAPAPIVAAFLGERFIDAPLILPAARYREFIQALIDTGVRGGAVYDALIGMTARIAGATLLTRDARAAATYDRLGVRYSVMSWRGRRASISRARAGHRHATAGRRRQADQSVPRVGD